MHWQGGWGVGLSFLCRARRARTPEPAERPTPCLVGRSAAHEASHLPHAEMRTGSAVSPPRAFVPSRAPSSLARWRSERRRGAGSVGDVVGDDEGARRMRAIAVAFFVAARPRPQEGGAGDDAADGALLNALRVDVVTHLSTRCSTECRSSVGDTVRRVASRADHQGPPPRAPPLFLPKGNALLPTRHGRQHASTKDSIIQRQHNLFIKTAYKHERQHNLFISHEESASRGLRIGASRRPRGYTPSNWGGGGQGGLRRGALSRHPRPQCFATRQLPHAGRTHHGPPIHRPPPTASVSLRANCSLSSVLGLGIRD